MQQLWVFLLLCYGTGEGSHQPEGRRVLEQGVHGDVLLAGVMKDEDFVLIPVERETY